MAKSQGRFLAELLGSDGKVEKAKSDAGIYAGANVTIAADGTLTTTTLPLAGGALTGAVTTNSTFDGRDVSVDGTKLDGVEASADVTDTTNVTAAGALMKAGGTMTGTLTATNLGQHQIATTLFAENIIKSSKATEAGGYIRMASSTQSVPTYTFVDDTNTGMFTSGADTLNFTTGGTERLRIASSGNVGIGTDTPKRPLQIGATGSFPISFNGNYPDIHMNTYYEGAWRIHTAGFGAKTTFNGATGAFGFSNVASSQSAGASFTPLERLTILANGNVGIGTTSPTMGLHVANGIGALFGPTTGASMYVSPDHENTLNGGYGMDVDTADLWINYRGYQNGASRFRDFRVGNGKEGLIAFFDGSSGNVGIGVTNPGQVLEIHNSNTSDYTDFALRGTGHKYVIGVGNDAVATVNDKWYLYDNDNGAFRMVVSPAGNVGIGTTSPAHKLDVQHTITSGSHDAIANFGTSGSGAWANSGHQVVIGGPSVLTYTGLIIHSDSTSGNGQVSFADGRGASDSWRGSVNYNHGNDSMAFATNAAERMRIDSSGNVGIGMAPSKLLDIQATDNLALRFYNSTSFKAGLEVATTAGDMIAESAVNDLAMRSQTNMLFATGGNTERMRIDSSGNVGIGTTTSSKVEINHGKQTGALGLGTATMLRLGQATGAPTVGNICQMSMGYGNVYANIAIAAIRTSATAYNTDDLVFAVKSGTADTAPTERMRIDSAGNVLVGTSDTTPYDNTSGNGILLGDGLISSAQSGGNAAIFNRMTNDGSIVQFRKDGTTVGDIGVNNNDNLRIQGNSGHCGLEFGTNAIYPHKNSANVDNQIDLGESGLRYKDLYLSGGVYLGGTGAANKLDDYEEGTWTPAVSGSGGTATASTATGYYTKVGNLVTVSGTFTWSANGSNANGISKMTGFPFASHSVSNGRNVGSFGAINGIAGANSLRFVCDPGYAWAYIITQNGTGYSHSNTFSASGAIYGFTMTYTTA